MRYCADIGMKHKLNVRSYYDSNISKLEETPSEMVCQEEGPLSPAAAAPIVVPQHDADISERTRRFVTQSTDISLARFRQIV